MKKGECNVCFELFQKEGERIPLVFKCGHSICANCAGRMTTNNSVKCPSCQVISTVPLPKNFGILSTLEDLRRPDIVDDTKLSSENMCDSCGEEMFEYFCKECNNYVCCGCNNRFHSAKGKYSGHTRKPTTRRFEILRLTCRQHIGVETRWYCNTCKCAICEQCCDIDGTHRTHNFVLSSNISVALKSNVEQQLANAQQKGRLACETLVQLEGIQASLGDPTYPSALKSHEFKSGETQYEMAKAAVSSHCAQMHRAIVEFEADMKAKIDMWVSEKTEMLKAHQNALQANLIELERYVEIVDEIQFFPDAESCSAYASVGDSLRQLDSSWACFQVGGEAESIALVADSHFITEAIKRSCTIGIPNPPTNVMLTQSNFGFSVSWSASVEVDKQGQWKPGISSYEVAISEKKSDIEGADEQHLFGDSRKGDFLCTQIVTCSRLQADFNDKRFMGKSVQAHVWAIDCHSLRSRQAISEIATIPDLFRVTFTYVSDFDTNGVLYYFGTAGGTRTYVNPHSSGDVVASWSGVAHGQEKNFVDHFPAKNGSNYTSSNDFQWMMVDLGQGRALMVTRYTLSHSHDAGMGHELRNWRFEGRANARDPWIGLRVHEDDASIQKKSRLTCTWEVSPTTHACRYFRILHTGVGASGSKLLMCSGIELYGDLICT